MRVLRGIGALVVWLLATVLLIVAAVLCITLILVPLGVPLMALALRLYGYGVLRKKAGGVADDAGKAAGRGRKKLAGALHG
jgi:hypothetical protein